MAKKNKESTRKRQDKIQSLDFQKKKRNFESRCVRHTNNHHTC